jgi:streptogramin lyase
MLMVSDTHYYQVLFYTSDGVLLEERTIGGKNGRGPGEFGFVTDVAQDSKGNYYVSEYGDYDRIQKFDSQGRYLTEFGQHGTEAGAFLRPQSLAIDGEDRLWIADVSNHRIQVFDVSAKAPKLISVWGEQGVGPGQLSYPNSVWIDRGPDGLVWICDMGNHRVQAFTNTGQWRGSWGGPGRESGQMYQPWALVRDSRGAVHVLDTYNHRVQRLEPKLHHSKNSN